MLERAFERRLRRLSKEQQGSRRMDRHTTHKGLHEMGGISQQAFSSIPKTAVRQGQTESKPRSVTFSTLQRARSQRARSTAAFSLYRPGPHGNAVETEGMPVRISHVRAEQEKKMPCPKPRHCDGCDLRFSFPHSRLFLHFLFLSARIGLGRSVKED